MNRPLLVATRGSALARAQAGLAIRVMEEAGYGPCEQHIVHSTGDISQRVAIKELPGQGWFTRELEEALAGEKADVAVHSAKDLPTEAPPGLEVAAFLPRADPRDALVSRGGYLFSQLPAGARVGTSSQRRLALLASLRPDLVGVPIRGNVDTRLQLLEKGGVDALLLASAGLDRLQRADVIVERLDPELFVPAPAQGAIALQVRSGSGVAQMVRVLDHQKTHAEVVAERLVLSGLGGGCLLPLGVWARWSQDMLKMTAVLAVDGKLRRTEAMGSDPITLARGVVASLSQVAV